MPSDIPSDPNVYKKLVMKVQMRMLRSSMWSDTQRQTWVRMYKIWRRIQDGEASGDEEGNQWGAAHGIGVSSTHRPGSTPTPGSR